MTVLHITFLTITTFVETVLAVPLWVLAAASLALPAWHGPGTYHPRQLALAPFDT